MRPIAIAAKRAVPPDHAAEVTAAILHRVLGRLREAAEAHELVVDGQERALLRPLLGAGYVLPAALGQEPVVAAGDKLCAVLERDPVGGLDRGPVREHLG